MMFLSTISGSKQAFKITPDVENTSYVFTGELYLLSTSTRVYPGSRRVWSTCSSFLPNTPATVDTAHDQFIRTLTVCNEHGRRT